MRGAGRPASAAALVICGAMWSPIARLVGHPQHGAVGVLACDLQHHRPERGDQHRHRRLGAQHGRVVHGERVVLDVDRTRAGDRGVEHLEIVAGVGGRLLVGDAEHVAHDPVVRRPDAERQPPGGHRMHRKCLAGKGDRMLRLQRHDGGAELDARGVRAPSAPPWSGSRSRRAPAASTRCPGPRLRPTRCRPPAWRPCAPCRRARPRSSRQTLSCSGSVLPSR